jgi:hypothetical protein
MQPTKPQLINPFALQERLELRKDQLLMVEVPLSICILFLHNAAANCKRPEWNQRGVDHRESTRASHEAEVKARPNADNTKRTLSLRKNLLNSDGFAYVVRAFESNITLPF